jgi:ABC-type dipeptide/oligopeptide/nickel transport system permease component
MAGDPVRLMTLGNPSLNIGLVRENLRAYYGLDKPIYVQYGMWLWRFLHFDLGNSFYTGLPVNTIIGLYAWETSKLQIAALLMALVIGVPIGVYSARKQYSKLDIVVTSSAIFGISIPIFYMGVILIIIFSFFLGWFPSFGAHSLQELRYPFGSYFLDEMWHLALPTFAIAWVSMALYTRVVRSSMLEILRQDYILAARASGLSEKTIIFKHALRNAAIPLVTYIGISLGLLLAGAPMTETVFTWPGLGYLYVDAVTQLDFPVLMGINMIITLIILAVNLITDLVYGIIDPRIRYE